MRMLQAALIVAAAALVGCESTNNVTGPSQTGAGQTQTAQTLTGSWRATKAEFVSAANSSLRVDIISQGSTLSLVLQASTFTLTIVDPGTQGQVTTGTWSSTRDTLSLTPSGMPFSWTFDMSLNGNTLTLTGGSVEFDFNADGRSEQAKLNLALTRQ
jgi:uncharacterized lipoprotein NlpE involved in copper resistance